LFNNQEQPTVPTSNGENIVTAPSEAGIRTIDLDEGNFVPDPIMG